MALLAGFLQVQTVYACEMMGEVFHGECCCDDDQQCADSNCDDVLSSNDQGCCETSLEVSVSSDEPQSILPIALYQVRSDVDPPALFVLPNFEIAQLKAIGHPYNWPVLFAYPAAQETYLITQRLRI